MERMVNTDCYRVQVAALPHYLNSIYSRRVFIAFLSADQVAQSLPFEREFQHIPTCDLRELVEQHAWQGCPPPSRQEENDAQASGQQRSAPSKDERLVSFPELFVSVETAKDAMEVIDEPSQQRPGKRRQRLMLQYIWLEAAMMMARRQMESAKWSMHKTLHTSYSTLHSHLCRIFEACHLRYRMFADARPAYIGHRQVGWYIRVSVPLALLAA
jgi:hypothetical protein